MSDMQREAFIRPGTFAPGSILADPELVLCGLSMVPISFPDLVTSAAAAGFDAISVGPAIYRRAVRDGLSLSDMKHILDDHGIWVSEVEGVSNWLTPAEDKAARWVQKVSDEDLLHAAEVLMARCVLVTHFGTAIPAERAGASFAALCDRSENVGLRVGLEFVAFATISDLHGAWDVVQAADRRNGGIIFDTWHYFRGNPEESLAKIPADRIFGLQLADADDQVSGALEEDVLNRRMPGSASLDLSSVVSRLAAMGVRAPVGIEVWNKDLLDQGPLRAAQHLHEGMSSFLASLSGSVEV